MTEGRAVRGAYAAAIASVGAIVVLLTIALGGLTVFVATASSEPALMDADGVGVADGLASIGVSPAAYLSYRVILEVVVLGTSVTAAILMIARRPPTGFACVVAVVIVAAPALTGVGAVALSFTLTGGARLQTQLGFTAVAAYFCLAYVFPNGRFVPRWTGWAVAAWAALVAWGFAGPWWEQGPLANGLASVAVVGLIAVAATAQIQRYRRVSSSVERNQTKWVATALVVRVGYMAVILLLPLVLGPWASLPPSIALPLFVITTTFSYLLAAATAASIAIAIVRYRLFDVDVWLSRAIAYVSIVIVIVIVYVVIVGGAGLIWPDADVLPAVAATALAAIALHPLRLMLTRLANRIVYGQRDDPATVLSRLGDRLAEAETADAMLRRVVETVAVELKLAFAAIETRGDDGLLRPTVVSGDRDPGILEEQFPLRFAGADLGRLVVKANQETPLRESDRRLLSNIAANAATAVQVARTTEELRRSREALIGAHESERRRLGRELHDGLGPTIASLHLRVDTAISLLSPDSERSAALLSGTRAELVSMIGEIRRIVTGLRPPGLDEVGLVAAVSNAIGTDAPDEIPSVRVDADDLPPLPAEVEFAAYRIVSEAVTNVRRHATGAQECVVRFWHDGPLLRVSIADDGPGIPSETQTGVGFSSMKERAREIGGSLTISTGSNGGTLVLADLPLGEQVT